MESYIHYFLLIPLIGFFISLLLPSKNESLISWSVFITVGLQLHAALIFFGVWLWNGHPRINLKEVVILKTSHYEFFIDLYFDKATAVFLLVGALLTFLVTIYSRYYLHREAGYRRFFATVLFFYFGYNVVIFSGNLETLFIGWEVLGVSSFLLIAYYRDRYLPVKNALKVFSVYRVGDIGLILAMWASHHLFHENITFAKLSNYELVSDHLQNHSWIGIFISLMILVTAITKSAQLPFSSWLPRAMEGPTPSSAIFYGSLSVHLGAFLLIRTHPFWQHQFSVVILIVLIGLFTSIIATGIARVQSSVKSQIAYSSISQIGLIFVEIGLGFRDLALYHFAANAFLRTYQLLVSPSVVTYLIREQFYNFKPHAPTIEDSWPKKLEFSLYMLCLKEWNLDAIMYRYLWYPMKWMGKQLNFLTIKGAFFYFTPVFFIGLIALYLEKNIPEEIEHYFTLPFAFIGLLMVLKAFIERTSVRMTLMMVIMNHFWIALAVSFNENFDFQETWVYLSGILLSGLVGYACLHWLKIKEANLNLDRFQGHSSQYPKVAGIFLLACLGLSGFPITPTFIGEDLIFSHIHEDQVLLAGVIALSFMVDGLAIMRIYARIFLGPNVKSVYERAYRSS
jgi:NADH:ubiquinone oxidoreductase subunit 5 (subunit L)/multisubunit Na+/H+ antiporter MnhA subunit